MDEEPFAPHPFSRFLRKQRNCAAKLFFYYLEVLFGLV